MERASYTVPQGVLREQKSTQNISRTTHCYDKIDVKSLNYEFFYLLKMAAFIVSIFSNSTFLLPFPQPVALRNCVYSLRDLTTVSGIQMQGDSVPNQRERGRHLKGVDQTEPFLLHELRD